MNWCVVSIETVPPYRSQQPHITARIQMRQVHFSCFGGPEVLEIVERPTPRPARGEVLVRVHAAGINFSDTLMRQNRYAVTPELPAIPGTEVAATIERLGDG